MGEAVPSAVGTVLDGRYELLEKLDDNAVFRAFKAQDLEESRLVVVKMLQPELAASPQAVARFEREVLRTTPLNHPNIARVYGSFDWGGVPCVVTEYVRGINLKERVKRAAPFPLAVAVDIALSLAEALDASHRLGIVHGDLRSHSVLISSDGRVKLTDYGLQNAVTGAGAGAAEQRPQSIHYLPPEVAEGQAPGPSSDIYSLGVILYEMLTGAVPFEGDNPIAVALRHAKEPPVPPSRLNAGVPRALDGIVLKCLQKDPARRYRSATVLLSDLRAVQEALRFGRPLQWSPLEETEEEEEPEVRSGSSFLPTAITAASIVILVSLVALVWLLYSLFSGTRDLRVPDLQWKDRAVAEKTLRDLGLEPLVHERPHNSVPAGQVFRQQPESGAAVKPGRQVELWVSQGPKPVTVPDLVADHVSVNEARRRLRAVDLVLGTVTREYNEDVPADRVVTQSPPPGTAVPPKSQVALVLSRGPAPLPPEPPAYEEPPPGPAESEPPAGPGPTFKLQLSIDVPRGPDPQQIQIEVTDDNGTNVVLDEPHRPGERFTRTIEVQGHEVLLRVYANGQIIFEQTRLPGNRYRRPDGSIGRLIEP